MSLDLEISNRADVDLRMNERKGSLRNRVFLRGIWKRTKHRISWCSPSFPAYKWIPEEHFGNRF